MWQESKIVIWILIAICGVQAGYLAKSTFFEQNYSGSPQKIGSFNTMVVDSSQRTIMVDSQGRFCSEPSPDVMNSITKEIAANLTAKSPTADAGTAFSNLSKNDLSKLFQRSQGIQALRDGMYRLCEAFINNAIRADMFELHMSELVATLNFIVPIELCSNSAKDIVSAIASSENLRSELRNLKPPQLSDSANLPVIANDKDVIGQKMSPSSPQIVETVLTNSDVLTSRFTAGCILIGAQFAGTLAQSSAYRSIAKNQIAQDKINKADGLKDVSPTAVPTNPYNKPESPTR